MLLLVIIRDYRLPMCSRKPDISATEADVQNVDEQDSVEFQKQHIRLAGGEGISRSPRWRVGSDCVCPI